MISIYDPVQEEVLLRYDAQSDEIKKQLSMLKYIDFDKYQLNVIKRKRPKLSRGDVFVLNPFGDIYFYGLVLNANINVKPLGNNLVSVCILKKYTHGIDKHPQIIKLTEENILLKPRIIHRSYWNSGYFYNIDYNVGSDVKLDYGFYDIGEKCYVDEYGKKMMPPKISNGFGFTTMIGVVRPLHYELIIDNSFLEEEDRQFFYRHFEEAVNYKPPEKELSEFDKMISPFVFDQEHKRRYSVILEEFEGYQEFFLKRSEALEGNGYDWEDLVKYYIKVNFADYRKKVHFDSEADMFYMYCSDEKLLKSIIKAISVELRKNNLEDCIMNAKFSDL